MPTSRIGINGVDQVPAIRGGEAPDRDAEQRRQQHDVGDERQLYHRAAESSDARQLHEQEKEADEKQVESAAGRGCNDEVSGL